MGERGLIPSGGGCVLVGTPLCPGSSQKSETFEFRKREIGSGPLAGLLDDISEMKKWEGVIRLDGTVSSAKYQLPCV